jgi:hypothetical protein
MIDLQARGLLTFKYGLNDRDDSWGGWSAGLSSGIIKPLQSPLSVLPKMRVDPRRQSARMPHA